MNDARISQFNAAGALSGEEYVPIAQLSNVTNTLRTVYTNPDAFKQFVVDSLSDIFCPVGTIGTYPCSVAAANVPSGWLLCNGQSIDRNTYKKLFDIIGTSYGCSSSTTFTLPNLKGRVVMGYCSSSSSISLSSVVNGNADPASTISLGKVGGKFNHRLISTDIPLKSSTMSMSEPLVITPSAATYQSIYSAPHIDDGVTVSVNSRISGGLRALYGGSVPPQITLVYNYRQACGTVTNGGTWQSLGCSGNNAWLGGSVTVAPNAGGDVLFQITPRKWGYQSLDLSIYVPSRSGSTASTTLSIARASDSATTSTFSVTQPYVVMNYIIKH